MTENKDRWLLESSNHFQSHSLPVRRSKNFTANETSLKLQYWNFRLIVLYGFVEVKKVIYFCLFKGQFTEQSFACLSLTFEI